MVHVEVVPAIGLRKILVRAAEIPLPTPRAGIIAWGGDAEQPSPGQDSCRDIVHVKTAGESDVLDLDFIGEKGLGRPAETIIPGMIETADVIRIEAYFRGEEL